MITETKPAKPIPQLKYPTVFDLNTFMSPKIVRIEIPVAIPTNNEPSIQR